MAFINPIVIVKAILDCNYLNCKYIFNYFKSVFFNNQTRLSKWFIKLIIYTEIITKMYYLILYFYQLNRKFYLFEGTISIRLDLTKMTFGNSSPKVGTWLEPSAHWFVRWFLKIVSIFLPNNKPALTASDTTAAG